MTDPEHVHRLAMAFTTRYLRNTALGLESLNQTAFQHAMTVITRGLVNAYTAGYTTAAEEDQR